MKTLISCMAVALVAVVGQPVLTQEVDAKLRGLSPALQKAVAAETRGATIKSVSKEKENGQTIYEVETIVGGRTRDVNFDASGAVLVVEEQTELDAIPMAARTAIEKYAGGGRIKTVELVTKRGTTTYEASVVKGGKTTEVVVNADGTTSK